MVLLEGFFSASRHQG